MKLASPKCLGFEFKLHLTYIHNNNNNDKLLSTASINYILDWLHMLITMRNVNEKHIHVSNDPKGIDNCW